MPPLGRNHGELAADNLLCDGQVAKVLVEGWVTTEAEGETGDRELVEIRGQRLGRFAIG